MPKPVSKPPEKPRTRGQILLLLGLCVALTVALPRIPYLNVVARPLMWLSTLVHELGHGIAGILVGGTFRKFEMHWSGSGVASVSHSGGAIKSAIVSAGGLVGPAVASAMLFASARRERVARWVVYGLGALLVLALVFVVRNLLGFGFVSLLALIFFAVARYTDARDCQLFLLFLGVQLALSVFSRGDYLFTDVARTANGDFPSDVANMSRHLWLPYWFWGAVCGAFSVAMLAVGTWSLLRKTPSEASARIKLIGQGS